MLAIRLALALSCVLLASSTWGEESQAEMLQVQQEIVNKHNALRRSVKPTASNMLKMSWSGAAEASAKSWAKRCILKHSPPAQRTIHGIRCGENLFYATHQTSWAEGIQRWYNEVKDYRYGHGAIGNAVVGHYTQVVWYRSNKIGCAMAHCPNLQFKYFYVCQYCPAGNVFYEGHNGFAHPYKKGPACGDCPKACDNGLCTNPCQYFDKCYRCPKLVKKRGCNGKLGNMCPASCKCHGSII